MESTLNGLVKIDDLQHLLYFCSKSSAHDEEVQKLYEEMEYQIKQEKERVLAEVRVVRVTSSQGCRSRLKKQGERRGEAISIFAFDTIVQRPLPIRAWRNDGLQGASAPSCKLT